MSIDIAKNTVQDFYSNVYDAKRPRKISKTYLKRNFSSNIFLLKSDLRKEKSLQRKLFKKIKINHLLNHKGNVKRINADSSIPIRSWKENVKEYKKYSDFYDFLEKQRSSLSKELRKIRRGYRRQMNGINLSSDLVDIKRTKIKETIDALEKIEYEKNSQIQFISEIRSNMASIKKWMFY